MGQQRTAPADVVVKETRHQTGHADVVVAPEVAARITAAHWAGRSVALLAWQFHLTVREVLAVVRAGPLIAVVTPPARGRRRMAPAALALPNGRPTRATDGLSATGEAHGRGGPQPPSQVDSAPDPPAP